MRLPVGLRLDGDVQKVTDAGIYVGLPNKRFGLVPPQDFGSSWATMRHRYRAGDQVRVVISQHRGRRIVLSLTRVGDPDLVDPTNEYSEVPDGNLADQLTKLTQDADRKIKKFKQMQL